MTPGADGPGRPGGAPVERARGWLRLARHLVDVGTPDAAVVAAWTSQALAERCDDAELCDAARGLVAEHSERTVRPLHVGMGADAAADPDEARAVWLGAPGERVLAMMGWVERDGELDVVRVVVPGTHRGRRAWSRLASSLPREIPVTLRLPARDDAVARVARRLGFVAHEVAHGPRERPLRYVGGSITLVRGAR